MILNGGLLFTRLDVIWFGLTAGFLHSPAYAGYEDYSGTLKVNGRVDSYEIALKVKAQIFRISGFPVFISLQPGLAYARTSIKQELKYFVHPQDNLSSKWSADACGPSFQSAIGPDINLGEFILSFNIGYRFAWNKVYEEKVESTGGEHKNFAEMNIGQYGIIFLLSFEKNSKIYFNKK